MNAGHLLIEPTSIRFPKGNHTMLQLIKAVRKLPPMNRGGRDTGRKSWGPRGAKNRREVEQQKSHVNKYPECVSPLDPPKGISDIEHIAFLSFQLLKFILSCESFGVGRKREARRFTLKREEKGWPVAFNPGGTLASSTELCETPMLRQRPRPIVLGFLGWDQGISI